jgi:transcriptional regulator with PAS, ATPase and Fis domain
MTRSRPGARQLARLLDSVPNPVYALDEARRLIYLNSACTAWLGIDAGDLLGDCCNYASGETSDTSSHLASALCPPPEVFHGRQMTAWVHCRNAQGKPAWRRGQFVPLAADGSEARGVLVVLDDEETSEEPATPPVHEQSPTDLHQQLQAVAGQYRARFRLEMLVGHSPLARRVREQVQLAIEGSSPVVIVGPPGSGREQVARTIHCGNDPKTAGPLMPLTCSLLDAELLQTTVLAFLRRCRDLPRNHPATLLLLHVDELSPDAQAELLAFFRVPDFGLRTIVTTQRDLIALAREEKFLHDLALALSVQILELPSLAERRQDIPFLAQQLLEEYNERGKRQFSGFTSEAMDRLGSLPWPGNIAELARIVAEATENAAGPLIAETDLPQHVRIQHSAAAHPPRETKPIVLDEFLGDIERELIQRALQQARNNKAQAARLLGINRARLLRRISQLDLAGD